MLPPASRRFFRLLSLVPSPDITAAAAAAAVHVSKADADRVLARLTEVHLLRPAGADRYSFYDLVRQLAQVKMDAEDEPGVRGAVLRGLMSSYLARVSAAAARRYPQMLRIPVAEPAEEHFVDGAAASAYMSLGGLHWRRGRHAESLRHHTLALALAQAIGWAEAEAATLGNIGTVHAELGALDTASSHLGRALAVNSRLGWRPGIAVNRVNLGLVARLQGRYRPAAEHYDHARRIYRELGSVSGEGICVTNLGEMLAAVGRTQAARDLLAEALTLHRSVGGPRQRSRDDALSGRPTGKPGAWRSRCAPASPRSPSAGR